MAFFEHRLDPCYSLGARGGPMWQTEVVKTTGGQRYANANWLYPLHIFDIAFGVKTEVDFAVIQALHYNVGGRRDAFRFKDWSDYRAGAGPVHPDPQALSLISGAIYQLNVAYTSGVRTFTRPIYKPVSGKVVVYRRSSGGTVTTISPTIDYTTGRVTVSGHTIGDTYTWSGQFDVPVAFVSDQLEAEILNKGREGLLKRWSSIQLEEVRL